LQDEENPKAGDIKEIEHNAESAWKAYE